MICVFTHHKCATNWLRVYFERFAELNHLRFAHTYRRNELPDGDVVLLTNANYAVVKSRGLNGLHVIRNPLSVVVSAYFSHLRTHPEDGWPELAIQRQVLRTQSKEAGVFLTTAFLERPDFNAEAAGPLHDLRTWDYCDSSFVTLRMEDLVQEPSKSFRRVFQQANVSGAWIFPQDTDFGFEQFTAGRQPGHTDESSHYRSGSPDDWQDHLPAPVIHYLTAHMALLFRQFYPDVLRQCAPVIDA